MHVLLEPQNPDLQETLKLHWAPSHRLVNPSLKHESMTGVGYGAIVGAFVG
jgi:hypothetical protein